MGRVRRNRRRERGSITVEALIWIPLLLYVAMMTLDFGMVMSAKTVVTEAAREAVRDVSVSPGCPSADTVWSRTVDPIIQKALKTTTPSWGAAGAAVPGYPGKTYLTVRCYSNSGLPYVEVTVNYLQEAVAPWLPRVVGSAPNPDHWLVSTTLVAFDER
ncbi:TadE family protein [Thermaerobacter litoralis]